MAKTFSNSWENCYYDLSDSGNHYIIKTYDNNRTICTMNNYENQLRYSYEVDEDNNIDVEEVENTEYIHNNIEDINDIDVKEVEYTEDINNIKDIDIEECHKPLMDKNSILASASDNENNHIEDYTSQDNSCMFICIFMAVMAILMIICYIFGIGWNNTKISGILDDKPYNDYY